MDEELIGTKIDHIGTALEDEEIKDFSCTSNDMDVHVVSNILDSLEIQGSHSGPVSTILKGMGLDIPLTTPHDESEGE